MSEPKLFTRLMIFFSFLTSMSLQSPKIEGEELAALGDPAEGVGKIVALVGSGGTDGDGQQEEQRGEHEREGGSHGRNSSVAELSQSAARSVKMGDRRSAAARLRDPTDDAGDERERRAHARRDGIERELLHRVPAEPVTAA